MNNRAMSGSLGGPYNYSVPQRRIQTFTSNRNSNKLNNTSNEQRTTMRRQSKLAGTKTEEIYGKYKNQDIFVSIASYRDPECPKTIVDCFKKAGNPSRVHVFVFLQNYQTDTGINRYPGIGQFVSNIHFMTTNATNAGGPMYARAKLQKFIKSRIPGILDGDKKDIPQFYPEDKLASLAPDEEYDFGNNSFEYNGDESGYESHEEHDPQPVNTSSRKKTNIQSYDTYDGSDYADHTDFDQADMQKKISMFRRKFSESFFLQIDSHTRFDKGWDYLFLEQWHMCNDPKAVLTMYPDDYEKESGKNSSVGSGRKPTFLTFHSFHEETGFFNVAKKPYFRRPKKPLPILYWAAGLSFSKLSMIYECPYDPHGKFIFLGEEILMAARLYTHGYNTYSPMTMIIFHYSDRSYRPSFWEQYHNKNSKVVQQVRTLRNITYYLSVTRLQLIMKDEAFDCDEESSCEGKMIIRQEPDYLTDKMKKLIMYKTGHGEKYGLGTDRTLQQYYDFIGINLKTQQYTKRSELGLSPNSCEEELLCKTGRGVY